MSKLFFSLFLLPFFVAAGTDTAICYLRDPAGRIREHNVDFIKMFLDVKFKPREGMVMGKVKYSFKPLQPDVDSVFLDAVLINTKTVLVDDKVTKFRQDSAGLTVFFNPKLNWNKEYKLEISYEAKPRKGIYFIGWNVDEENTTHDKNFTRKQIWTQGQGIDNRHWIPCYDDVTDKLLTETKITFDSAYTVVSNGSLKEKKINPDGTCTWNYAMNKPMVSYLIMIAIDKFAYKDYKSKNGMVSRQYYYADHPELAAPTYRYSDEMMDFLSAEFGVKYPWPSYCNVPVQDFMYGAMENTTATIYGDFILNDERQSLDRYYYGTNAHELTHQWFGDYITEYSAHHHWLHESFATYYSKQFVHHRLGEDRYEWEKHLEANQAIGADKNDRFPVAHAQGGSARHYPKGSFAIDMMRYVVGDSVFKRCITSYLKEHAYSNVSNHDLMMAFIDYAGINLDWFFDEWIYRSGIPEYEVRYEKKAGEVLFYINQTQITDELTSVFKMPVVIELWMKDGTVISKKFWNEKLSDSISIAIPAGKELDYTLFDPSFKILKILKFNRTYEELVAQAEKAKSMIDRYDALIGLRETPIETKRGFLIQLFNKNDFHAVRAEIIKQLYKDRDPASVQVFKKAFNDKDFLVRRSVIEDLDEIPAEILSDAEKLLADSSYNTIEIALRKLCKQFPANAESYLQLTKEVTGLNKNVRILWLEIQIADKVAPEIESFKKELIRYSSNRYEFRSRVKAIEAIERLGLCSDEVIRNLFNACLYTNGRLSNPAAKALRALIRNSENKDLAKAIYAIGEWEKWQSDILRKFVE